MGRPKKVVETKEETVQATAETVKEETSVAAEKPAAAKKTAPETPQEKTYGESEVQKIVEEAVARALAQQKGSETVRLTPASERVLLQWNAEVSDENVVEFGDHGMYGRITGKTGSFYVPKDELSRIMDGLTRLFLERRWLIVVSGLTDEEREAYGVNYKENELLDKAAFAKMVELGRKMLDIYPRLCEGHREMVAKRYYEAWTQHSKYVTRDIIRDLQKISKEVDGGDGAFKAILDEMNASGVD